MTDRELMQQALAWIEAQPEPRMLGALKIITALRAALVESERNPLTDKKYRCDEWEASPAKRVDVPSR